MSILVSLVVPFVGLDIRPPVPGSGAVSLLLKLAIVLGIVTVLVGAVVFWMARRQRKREEVIRKRGPDATIRSDRPPEQKTDHWNITR